MQQLQNKGKELNQDKKLKTKTLKAETMEAIVAAAATFKPSTMAAASATMKGLQTSCVMEKLCAAAKELCAADDGVARWTAEGRRCRRQPSG